MDDICLSNRYRLGYSYYPLYFLNKNQITTIDMTPLSHDILRAWQRIEFFQPYSLEPKDKSLLVSLKTLQQSGDKALPWLSAELRQQYDIPPTASFSLHLGLFEKSIASDIARQIFGAAQQQDDIECEQRLNREGITCFAKVILNPEGVPAIDRLSVSSLPWAMGHLNAQRVNQLESKIFLNDCEQLADSLRNFQATLTPVRENGMGIMRATDIMSLLMTHLVTWADFEPEWKYFVQIDWYTAKSNDPETIPEESEEEESEEEPDGRAKEFALPILNSFFFEDIEKAITSLKQDHPCTTLRTYLSHRVSDNPDLYSQAGLAAIIDKLHPEKMPLGRWPAESAHPMSLMQQFAINTAVEELADGGVLSVNGPPGTGKTTLLRDLVAHNVVERAKILSGFQHVDTTLDDAGFIVPALTGYEMLIASSNNAAVENISKELPQKKSLGEAFRSLDFLAATANQLAAEARPERQHKKNKKGEGVERKYHLFRPLEEQKQCWGMISAALGSKKNREKFACRLLFDEHFLRNTSAEMSRPANENFLSLWRWRSCHTVPAFSEARQAFIRCLQQTEQLQQQLITFARLLNKPAAHSLNVLIRDLSKAQKKHESCTDRLKQSEVEYEVIRQQVKHAEQEQKMTESKAPGWLSRLLNPGNAKIHQAELERVQEHLLVLGRELVCKSQRVAELNQQCNDIRTEIRDIQQKIETAALAQAEEQRTLSALQQQFSDVALPDVSQSISDEALQRTAFWQNAQINQQRSRLFIAAIDLHQAWLHEVLGIDHFRKNILKLANFLAYPHTEEHPLRWWQLLFMIVPVISTTFASVGRMLKGVESEALGWLMIDEAGQAAPQQAVGAIWRARRVLIVGDPLQIEPVFTTSPVLVKHLCQEVLADHGEMWDPSKLSVQQVADRVNLWGCELEVMNNLIRIGIPLWVHRRCIEPMFSIANKLAYNNRMIHGLSSEKICSQAVNHGALENHWIFSSGGQGEKQYRDSHGKDLLRLLDRLLSENVALQSIYIITPFKAVKTALIELIEQRALRSWQ